MFVIRLPNGNLMVPESAIGEGGRVIGDAYVEIGPGDADYERLAKDALTEEEVQRRRLRWQEEDEALQREFLAYRAQRENSWPGENSWSDPGPNDGQDRPEPA
jgi:hypothetical protein